MRVIVERDVYDRLGMETGFGFVETFSSVRPGSSFLNQPDAPACVPARPGGSGLSVP